ncbi:MAG: hypothetical protein ACI85F_002699 [Bacteroidia bacterium]|jgi:hypothetical protein
MRKLSLTIAIVFLTTITSNGQVVLDGSGNPTDRLESIKMKNSYAHEKMGSTPASVINVIPSPTESIIDIAFDGQYLWTEGSEVFRLHQISTIDGSIIR